MSTNNQNKIKKKKKYERKRRRKSGNLCAVWLVQTTNRWGLPPRAVFSSSSDLLFIISFFDNIFGSLEPPHPTPSLQVIEFIEKNKMQSKSEIKFQFSIFFKGGCTMLRMPFLKCFTLSINAFFHLKRREKKYGREEREKEISNI